MRDSDKSFILGALLFLVFSLLNFKEQLSEIFSKYYAIVIDKLILWVPNTAIIIGIFIFAKFLTIIVNSILSNYFKFVHKEREYKSMKSVSSYVIWTLAVLAVLSVVIGNLGVWLTSLGLIGFGVTFALQKPILNFVAWMNILVTKTYMVGDRIQVGDQRGDVIEIQMMNTVMDGLLDNSDELSGKIVTVPNSLVLTSPVVNFTKNGLYLWDSLSADITYESDWKKAINILQKVTFKVVNTYVRLAEDEPFDKYDQIVKNINALKKESKENEGSNENIESKIEQLKEEKKKLEAERKKAVKNSKKKPTVRVEMRASSIGLNVRYLAHYSSIRKMESEISTYFLKEISKTDDVEVAYPHMQIVSSKKSF